MFCFLLGREQGELPAVAIPTSLTVWQQQPAQPQAWAAFNMASSALPQPASCHYADSDWEGRTVIQSKSLKILLIQHCAIIVVFMHAQWMVFFFLVSFSFPNTHSPIYVGNCVYTDNHFISNPLQYKLRYCQILNKYIMRNTAPRRCCTLPFR